MKHLKIIRKRHAGRDATGKVSMRHQGGGSKQFVRIIDFLREKTLPGKVVSIEYDPNRTCDIALVQYADGEKRYILCPSNLNIGDIVASGDSIDIKPGNTLPVRNIPLGTFIHNVELAPGKGGQIARSAGTAAIVLALENDFMQIKMPSGEIRRIPLSSRATIGQLGKVNWKDRVFKKAGTKRHMGIRPTVRGVAQNPRSHPHGGGEGRSGIGMNTPKTYAGRPAVGNTRNKKKYSNKYIVQRRKK